jgi:hypothetical protein
MLVPLFGSSTFGFGASGRRRCLEMRRQPWARLLWAGPWAPPGGVRSPRAVLWPVAMAPTVGAEGAPTWPPETAREAQDLRRARQRPPMGGGVVGAPPPAIIFPSSAELVLRPTSSAARAPFLAARGESAATHRDGRWRPTEGDSAEAVLAGAAPMVTGGAPPYRQGEKGG